MMTEYLIHDDIPEVIFNNFMKLEKIAVDTELHGLTMNRDQIFRHHILCAKSYIIEHMYYHSYFPLLKYLFT